jgi:hypothetical protein
MHARAEFLPSLALDQIGDSLSGPQPRAINHPLGSSDAFPPCATMVFEIPLTVPNGIFAIGCVSGILNNGNQVNRQQISKFQ